MSLEKTDMSTWLRTQILFISLVTIAFMSSLGGARSAPNIFWASDPIRPDETVLVVGSDLADVVQVQIERPADNPEFRNSEAIDGSHLVEPIRPSKESLRFVIPRQLPPGVYRFTLIAPSGRTSGYLNVPSVYWSQGDKGRASSPGGWIRVFGRNIGREAYPILSLARADRPEILTFQADRWSLWDASFSIPQTVEPGTYSLKVWNGNGDHTAWREAGVIEVQATLPVQNTMVDVKTFGALGDGKADDTAAIQAALRSLGDRGGILSIPRGYYLLSESLSIPRNVSVRGEGRNLTRLVWKDFTSPPTALMHGLSDFSIEDLAILTSNHGHVISGGFDGSESVPAAANITIRRVTVRASMYRGHLKPEQTTQRLLAALKFSTGGPDTIRLSGSNLVVEESDIYGSGRSFYLLRPRGARIKDNKFYNGRWGWYSITGADGVIFENNQVIGADLQSTGGGINTLSARDATAQNVIFLRNKFELMHGWDREAMTSDGPGGCYYGNVRSSGADPTVLIGASDAMLKPDVCNGAGLFIVNGHGMGQFARINYVEGNILHLDRSLKVAVDESSIATVVPLQQKYLIIGNHFSDAGVAVQFFGSSLEHVVAGNTSERTGGFVNRGLNYYGRGLQPSWYTQFLDNHIMEGGLANDSVIQSWDSQKAPRVVPLVLATIIRGNILAGNSHINLKGGIAGAPGVLETVVEGNHIKNSEIGIVVDEGAQSIHLRNNYFQNVRQNISIKPDVK